MITPCLWLDGCLAEAVEFYTSVFPNSSVGRRVLAPQGHPRLPAGHLMLAEFVLDGRDFSGIDGGPHDRFNDAVSFVVPCADQEELDRYWDALLAGGGVPVQCGWLKDRFGVSWQVVPRDIHRIMGVADPAEPEAAHPDPEADARVNDALMRMVKIDIAALEAARRGGA